MVSTSSSIEAELDRILKSKWLRESSQLSTLLSYVVEETLAGREAGLKEYALGLEVFHRPKDYDPRNDAIVRVQASLLRKRLASYYENEGKSSSVRIEIPRGGYIADFRVLEPEAPPVIQPTKEVEIVTERPPWRMFVAGLVAGVLVAVLAMMWWLRPPQVESKALWGALVDTNLPVVASFGVPLFYTGNSGLYFRDVQVNALSDEKVGRIQWLSEKLGISLHPQADVYTGLGDAIGTHQVARWLEKRGVEVTVANSNYIGPSDIDGKNLVVIASARFQTMLQSMTLENRYHFDREGVRGGYTLDHPLDGELAAYLPTGTAQGVGTDYAVLSVWPGRKPGTRILHFSGTSTWSTQGAAQFSIDRDSLIDLERRLSADPDQGPRGRKGPYMQVLVQVEGKNNRVRGAKYVSHRYLSGN